MEFENEVEPLNGWPTRWNVRVLQNVMVPSNELPATSVPSGETVVFATPVSEPTRSPVDRSNTAATSLSLPAKSRLPSGVTSRPRLRLLPV